MTFFLILSREEKEEFLLSPLGLRVAEPGIAGIAGLTKIFERDIIQLTFFYRKDSFMKYILFISSICFLPHLLAGKSFTEKFAEIINHELIEINQHKYAPGQLEEINHLKDDFTKKLRIVSYNLLWPEADKRNSPSNHWQKRLPRIAKWITQVNPDIIGTQELSPVELKQILGLVKGYEYYGLEVKKINDPKRLALTNGVLYSPNRLKIIEAKTFAISQNPEIMLSVDPFMEQLYVTLIHFVDKKTNKAFYFLNTHLSNDKASSREYGARFISNLIKQLPKDLPKVLTGDFNTFAPLLDKKSSVVFRDGSYIENILTSGSLYDSRSQALLGIVGSAASFTDHNNDDLSFTGDGTDGILLDHIFVTSNVKVLVFGVDPYRENRVYFPSDHKPVVIDAIIK